MIPIHFENDDKAKLLTNGEGFTIEAHLDKVHNTKYWIDESSYGLCYRDDITIAELIKLLPQISEYLKAKIEIKEDTSTFYVNEHNKVELSDMQCITYRIIIDNKCVFKKNTIHSGSVLALREQAVAWVARFIYDHEIITNCQKEWLKDISQKGE